jgi:hypothetical protein
MIAKRLARQSYRFRNGIRGNVAAPLLNDRFPGNAPRHLLHDVSHQDSSSSERRLAMADRGIGDDVPSDHALGNLVLLTLRHCEYLKHNYSWVNPDGSPLTPPG